MPETRLGPDASDEQQDALAAEVMERALDAGQQSVKRGPDLLPVLREAGVVDAGGYGLTVVLAGMVGALRGTETVKIEHHAPPRSRTPSMRRRPSATAPTSPSPGATSTSAATSSSSSSWATPCWSSATASTLKVHVHTDTPDAAMALFEPHEVSQIDIADMSEQVKDATRGWRSPVSRAGACGAVCGRLPVVTGEGFRQLFVGLGVAALDGGPTLNPSTNDLLAAIHAVPAEHVVVLPNSSNVFMAAERAAELSDKNVVVVRSRSLQAGLAAAVALDPRADAQRTRRR